MSIVEKQWPPHAVDYGATDDGMPTTTSICIALVVALILYVAGSVVLQRDVAAGAPRQAGPAEMSFHGP